jgi:hypothetical protein
VRLSSHAASLYDIVPHLSLIVGDRHVREVNRYTLPSLQHPPLAL